MELTKISFGVLDADAEAPGVRNSDPVLGWRYEHPMKRIRSPFGGKPVRTLVSERLARCAPADAPDLVRLAPWHPLGPVALARDPGPGRSETSREFLCKLTLARLRDADPRIWSSEELEEIVRLAAGWMRELGFPELAEEAEAL